jgi:hypothetical protein
MNIRLPVHGKVQFECDWSVPGRGGADSSVSCLASSDSSWWGDTSGCDDTASVLEKYGHIKVPSFQRPLTTAGPTNKFKDLRMYYSNFCFSTFCWILINTLCFISFQRLFQYLVSKPTAKEYRTMFWKSNVFMLGWRAWEALKVC